MVWFFFLVDDRDKDSNNPNATPRWGVAREGSTERNINETSPYRPPEAKRNRLPPTPHLSVWFFFLVDGIGHGSVFSLFTISAASPYRVFVI